MLYFKELKKHDIRFIISFGKTQMIYFLILNLIVIEPKKVKLCTEQQLNLIRTYQHPENQN
jgi:hypothetical protein